MKTLILTCALVVASLCLLACSSQGSVDVSCDDFYELQHISQAVDVAVGDSFTVTLCSNPTTGFQWSELADIGDQTVLQQIDHRLETPEGQEPPAPGSPGKEVWTFKALEEGKSSVSMAYSRPWQGGEKGEWTFDLTVVVR